ncbi:uncharacterized protein [Thunnus thynnus]|uniref:uncharacterized protein n=1 Tax=Thunnus thynnus TaxID=8237 RepID=UPI00352976F4
MNQCEETEEGVHPSETPLCGQHDNQTKAQSPEKQQIPDSQVLSKPMVRIQALSRSASAPPRPDFSESLFSHPLKKVAAADLDSVLSSDSWLGSLESLSSDLKKDSFRSSDSRRLDFIESLFSHLLKDVATVDDVSVLSSGSGISLGSLASSGSSCVSNQSEESEERYITFKKNGPDFGESLFSHPLKKVATADGDSFWSSDSGLGSLESLSSDLKKDSFRSSDSRCMLAMNQCEETEEGVHPSETPLCGQHDNQTKAQSPEQLHEPDSQVFSKPMVRIRALSRSASAPEVSVDSGSSETSCVSMKSDSSRRTSENFKGEEEKDELPITQELVVGSSAGMETKSTPVAVPTSLLTTIQPADASTHPLPATRDKAKSKWGTKMFRKVRTMFMRNEEVSVDSGSSETSCVSMKSDLSRGISPDFKGKTEKTSSSTTQELVVGSSAEMETKSTPVAVPTSLLTTIQPADASTHPLPATRDKAKSKWGTKMFRKVQTMFRRNEESP